jgi:hypothetical protein
MDQKILTYRQQQKFLYNWKEKYSKLIEFDPIKRNVGRLVNFAKKYIVYVPCNLSECMINEIPGIYRFRCYVYDTQAEMDILNEIYTTQSDIINLEPDIDIRCGLIESLKKEINDQKKCLINSKSSIKYGILLDLRNYLHVLSDMNPDVCVFFDNKLFTLDDVTARRLRNQCEKINPNTVRNDKFIQMINHSKALSKTYNLETIKEN